MARPHNRESLVGNAALSVTGSSGAALGVYDVAAYAKFAGIISLIGSGNFSYSMGVNSANASMVTSSFVVNSTGGVIFDVANFGQHASFNFTQLSSQASAKILLYGETAR